MYFFNSFSYLYIFIFILLSNINIFSGSYNNEPMELEKESLGAYITLGEVKPMNITDKNKQFFYMLVKENDNTKKEDISVTIPKNIIDSNNKLKKEDTNFKLVCDDNVLKGLRILCIAEGYYVIFYSKNIPVSDNKVEEKLICLQKNISNDTLSFDENIYLTKKNLKKDIETINSEGDVDYCNYILNINSISGLKIYGKPVKLDLK